MERSDTMYNKVTSDIIEKLKSIVGAENVITGREQLEPYSHDEIPDLNHFPEVVVQAGSAREISQILVLANENKIPVTPRGGGTGLSGGAVPFLGGIVLSLERMDKILEIDEDNMMVIVQPGVVTGTLQAEVEKTGLFYPPDPSSLDSCTIGGNIAENAGGPRAVKYGVTRDYVCGLEVVLPTGELTHCGGKIVKNVSGYDLMQLLIGSEGTLGIVTEITLRLLPLPKAKIDLLAPFDSLEKAALAVTEIIRNRSIMPAAVEFIEKEGVQAAGQFLEKELPFSEAEAQVIIELDGSSDEGVLADAELVGEICLEHGASDVLAADNPSEQERLWEARRIIGEALKHVGKKLDKEDVVVPRMKIPELIKKTKEIAAKYGVTAVNFGHVGDGNVHVNTLKKDLPDAKWEEVRPRFSREILQAAVDLGGTVTGEHGIGLIKKDYLSMAVDESQVRIMRQIKLALDPNDILNPGKIFPDP